MGPRPGGPMGGMGLTLPDKAQDFRGAARRMLSRLRPERLVIALVLLLASISVVLVVLGPKILGNATNLIFEGVISAQLPAGLTQAQVEAALRAEGDTQQADLISGMTLTPGQGVDFTALGQVILLAVLVYLLSSLFSWAQNYLMAGVTQRTVFRLREEVDLKLGRLPLKTFDQRPRGDMLSRVTNDIDNIATTLQQVMTQLITSVLTVVGVLAMMFWISPLLAVIALLTVPLSFGVTMAIASGPKQFVGQWKWTGTLNGHVEECTPGTTSSRSTATSAGVADFDAANDKMYETSFRAQFISGLIQPAMAFIANVNYVLIAVIGGLQVANGAMSLGDVQAFIQYSRQFTMPITQIASITNLLQSGLASVERVLELLDEDEETPDAEPPVELAEVRGAVRFEDVAFQYTPDRPLIGAFDLAVQPGETVAIVGPTGAGKTTLVNLLMRFYDVDSGRITLDGVDIRDLRRDDLRRQFGMVLQDTWLFDGTIRENIEYGARDATDEQVVAAAKAARVDHFVRTLPDGYDTVLGDDATSLSAGEQQLLTIARAFLADPSILILDEATSSVDTRTEVLIQQAMAELRRGRTSFVIAHRLSTTRDADTILVMDAGHIVEQGSHEDPSPPTATYDLYQSQFTASADDAA
jgi:ATP-binding cassette subfamily B protein